MEIECPVCLQKVPKSLIEFHCVRHLIGQQAFVYYSCWCDQVMWSIRNYVTTPEDLANSEWRQHFRENGGVLSHMRHGIILGRVRVEAKHE